MRRLNRREGTLLGLLAVVGVVLLWNARVTGLLGLAGPRSEGLPPLTDEPPTVNTALLKRPPAAFDINGRDLFKYYTPPPPPVKYVPPKYTPPPPPPPPPPKPPQETKPVSREPQPPEPDFKYIGFLGTKDNPIGVFLDGEDMIQAQVGEVLDEQFELVEFRYETAVFGFVDERFAGKTTELKLEGALSSGGKAAAPGGGRSTARR